MSSYIWDGDTDTIYTTDANWQGAADPAAAGDVFFPSGNSNPVAGSDQHATELTSLTTQSGYTGAVGSITAGLPTPLWLHATTFNLAGTGLSYLKLDAATTVNITGASSTGLYLQSAGTITTLNINIANGVVYLATLPGEVITITNLFISGSGTVHIGSGAAITTLTKDGCTVYNASNITTVTQTGSDFYQTGTATLTTGIIKGGTLYYNSNGTITTLTVQDTGEVNFDGDNRAVTVTTTNLYKSARIVSSNGRVTWTNKPDPKEGMIIQVQ